jgi:hypothetical protein
MTGAVPFRRITLLALLSLSLLAFASRMISGVGIPDLAAAADPSPNAAFGTLTYAGMTDAGLHVWEFSDPSCPGPVRVLLLPLSDESAPVSRFLRQPGEDIAYWYDGVISEQTTRPTWLFRFAVERLRSPLKVKDRLLRDYFYLMIFHPSACAAPPGADWPMVAAAIRP